ncbi:hypothetical protein DYBT9275_03696 [Dyadobacter sp. CECT 9275]|uniref:Uncharacterized protein n=1 Tax=Dyadobacter helix TaxID=2822344 RepID=A0A916JF32_9BACT|nr:hypothetical protein DYBT9275_03696 [Dyadobacter sp. CECT 9275]
MKQYDKKHEIKGCKPVRAVIFLFFALFLLSNCQVKKTLSTALLNHSGAGHTSERIDKGLPVSVKLLENEPCAYQKGSAYSDPDLHMVSATVTLPSASLFLLSYLPFLLIFDGFSGDNHVPLTNLFKVLPAASGSPIYIKNRYLLI